jgi:ferredoxin
MPKQEYDECKGCERCAEVSPTVDCYRIEWQHYRKKIDKDVISMIIGCSNGDIADISSSFGNLDAQPQKPIGDDNHEEAEPRKPAIRKEGISANCPEDEQRRNTAQHHQHSSDF